MNPENKNLWIIGIVVAAILGVAILVAAFHSSGPKSSTTYGINNGAQVQNYPFWFTNNTGTGAVVYGGRSQQWAITDSGAETVNGITNTGGITEVGGPGTVNVFPGTTITNNVVFGSGGYSNTFSTTVGTSFTVTPQQFCSATSLLIPVGNTTTVTLVLPAASTTFATCGATVGSWSDQIVENDSSFAVTEATSTGQVFNPVLGLQPAAFYMATGTPAGSLTYPPKIQASTTAEITGLYNSTTSIEYLVSQLSRPTGF